MKAHYPWPQYRQPWLLDVEIAVDEKPANVCDAETRRIHLDQANGWIQAVLSIAASTSEVSIDHAEEVAMATLSIPRTNTRIVTELSAIDGGYRGNLAVTVNELRGVAELNVQILNRDGRRVIGDALTWKVIGHPGDAPPTPGAPPFEWKWEDFQSSPVEAVSQARNTSDGAFSVVDVMHSPKPIVYLDKSVPGLQAIIESKAPREEKRRLQNIIGTGVARDIIRAVLRSALDECIVEDDVPVEPPDDPVRLQVLAAIADTLDVDVAEFCEELLVATPEERAIATRRAELAIDSLVGHGVASASAVEEVS